MPFVKLPISVEDLENLRASGLSDATIRANRLKTENDVLVFPYRNLAGKTNGFTRTRPHIPRVDKDGKQVKYEQAKGSPVHAYFPAGCLKKIRDKQSPIYVTEGEKKALALSQLGIAAVGLGGVWCACKKGTEELIDDLAAIDWAGRDVYIVFDFDEKDKTRQQVGMAKYRLARVLRAAGAKEIYDVELPPGLDDKKQGVDDLLVDQGEELFSELVDEAEPMPTGIQSISVPSGRTDSVNAARLVERHGLDIRWVGAWDKWLIWNGQVWSPDQARKIDAFAKQSASTLWSDIKEIQKQGDVLLETVKAMMAFAKGSNNASGIRATVGLARSEPGVCVQQDELDSDPWLLNVENGTLDLRTGDLREHRRADFLTKMAPVTFDPAATCPRWRKFLQQIFAGDDHKALTGYMQRLMGYGLTAVTEEHILPFLYGSGANGKSTLVEAYLSLLGTDYAMKAPPDLLLAKRGEAHPTERADLFGKRFAAAVETEAGRSLAESLVKELTGGDRIRARRMREDFWEFAPTHKVWLAGNHKPTVHGTDHGIWRRLKLIPFNVIIADEKQDKKLPEKLSRELSGILNWALEGCLDWQHEGLQEPDIVREATKEYSEEMDDVGEFLASRCETGDRCEEAATVLFNLFRADYPESSMSQKAFGAELKRQGFESFRFTKGANKAKKGWRGVRLNPTMGEDFVNNMKRKEN